MKRLSLKVKLTIVYTFFTILVTCTALGILISLSSREVLTSTQNQLERRVQESVEDIEAEDGILEADSDLYSAENGIYLSVYKKDGYFLFGKVPYGFDGQPDFSDGEVRKIRQKDKEWYVYDLSYRLEEKTEIMIRGVTSVSDAEESFRITMRLAFIILPVLVIVEAFIGYRFTRRTLLPVKKITETVQDIQADADLSRRVELTKEQTCCRDEIYSLAHTFDQMLGQLEEVFRREKQFTSDVSHELRTPVSVILAQCETCLADEELSGKQKEQIRLIERKARQMAGMISNLLLLSRVDEGRQTLQKERIDISELTEMTVEEQQMLTREKGKDITFYTDIAPHIYMEADESFYIRLLVNLVSNAVYYSKESGWVKVSLKEMGKEIVGTVEDNGTGIAAEALPHIWERFYRADASRTDSSHSGLGLSMVKWIVQAHGGRIEVKSEKDKGSRFTFYFPF